jgi:ABC-type multidrug transport system fused ATPase/permease subunit
LQSAAEEQAERQDGSAVRVAGSGALSIRDLEVKFGERTVLDRISLRLDMPGLLAVVGPSGAGKSTLVHTLLGLVEPSAGSIVLGAHDLSTMALQSWRAAIGYVPQETILFHASIRDNLTMLNPQITQAEIEDAARRAHAYDFIVASENGFDTIVGDQGAKLSGGQRQRLGIARALLQKPALLLLDEPMSALDAESEAVLLRTIDELQREMGVVMVAHRLASLRNADRICVLEQGRVAETGTWDDLMGRRSRLHALVQAQGIGTPRAAAVG